MNSDPLNELWNSAANRHDPVEGERVAAAFATRLRRRRRFQAWWLGWTFLALTATTALALLQHVGGGAAAGKFASSWALAPLLALPWIAAVYFARAFVRENAALPHAALPLREVLAAADAANRRERRRLMLVLGLLTATAPLAALAIRQLQHAGKAAPHEAWSMSLVFGLALALGAAAVILRLRYWLQPERRAIKSLLRELDKTATH